MKLFWFECRKIFLCRSTLLLSLLSLAFVVYGYFSALNQQYLNYGMNRTTGYINEQGQLLSVQETIAREAEIRSSIAGKMDGVWLENFYRDYLAALTESDQAIIDFDAMEKEYGKDWYSEYQENPDAWIEPFYPADLPLEGSEEEKEEARRSISDAEKRYEEEAAGKKKLIFRDSVLQHQVDGVPLACMKSRVYEMDLNNYIKPLVIEKVWKNADGLIEDEVMYDNAGREESVSAWPNTRLSREQISFYGRILEEKEPFVYGSPGTADAIFQSWILAGMLLVFLSIWCGSRAVSMDQTKNIPEMLFANTKRDFLIYIKAAALICSIILLWGLLFGAPLLIAWITHTWPDQQVNMMFITNLCNIYSIGQGLGLNLWYGFLSGLATGILAFGMGFLIRVPSFSLAASIIVLFIIPELFLKSIFAARFILPAAIDYMPAFFDWSFELFGKIWLLVTPLSIWWIFWSTFLLLICFGKWKRHKNIL